VRDNDVEELRDRLIAAGYLVALSPHAAGELMTTETGVAFLIGRSLKTVRNIRDRTGPPCFRHDGRVWYGLTGIARHRKTGNALPCQDAAEPR
jgi:hypothetical protein